LNWTVCVEAEDGVDAIVKAQQLRPDVIVMDFSMPIMNGLDSAKRLKALLPKIPIVMFTNRVGPDVEQQALALGVHSVRSKSDETSLVQSIRAVI
jgi:CheY-like chemotaxis protein